MSLHHHRHRRAGEAFGSVLAVAIVLYVAIFGSVGFGFVWASSH